MKKIHLIVALIGATTAHPTKHHAPRHSLCKEHVASWRPQRSGLVSPDIEATIFTSVITISSLSSAFQTPETTQTAPKESTNTLTGSSAALSAITSSKASTPSFTALPTISSAASPAVSSTATSTSTSLGFGYGLVLDEVDAAPSDKFAIPTQLPERRDGKIAFSGRYTKPFTGSLGGEAILMRYGEYLDLSGTGYFTIRWEIAWFNRAGVLQMPIWTRLDGKVFHVASGGGRRMTDLKSESSTTTWYGPPDQRSSVPSGVQDLWQNEFYYLDGSVRLYNVEGSADYNLGFASASRASIYEDLNQTVTGSIKRKGIARDTGDDLAPVPVYLSRSMSVDLEELKKSPNSTLNILGIDF